jgi:hypothetical protein
MVKIACAEEDISDAADVSSAAPSKEMGRAQPAPLDEAVGFVVSRRIFLKTFWFERLSLQPPEQSPPFGFCGKTTLDYACQTTHDEWGQQIW